MELEFNVNDSNCEIEIVNLSDKDLESEDNDLVELVTCAIHLGKFDDPRKLNCQHAFCYKCLQGILDREFKLNCPICRQDEGISDVNQLPPALLENQLLELIKKNGIKHSILASVNLSDDEIEEHDMNTNGEINDPVIMEYMSVNGKYECVEEYSSNILQNISQKNITNIESEFSIFDIFMIDGQPKSMQLVLLDCRTSELIVISECNPRRFYIKIENIIVTPEYMRIFRNTLILSGKLARNNVYFSVFLQCNMNGEILNQSELIPWLDTSGIPMMVGFDIDENKGSYYLCLPQSNKVAIYNSTMIESDFYGLGNNRPEYVAVCFENNQLWISCSQNGRILVLNRESSYYKTITSGSTIPKMIFSINDEKIIYLDSSKNRLIWIYLENNVYSQPLELVHVKREFVIKSIHILSSSQIIINTGSQILRFQSTTSISKWFRVQELCCIL